MVSKREEEEVKESEKQADNGGGGEWEYLSLVRKLKLRRSIKVLKHRFSILNDPHKRSALGSQEWTLYEQVAIAAMDCQCTDVAKDCIKVLQKKFPESKRVGGKSTRALFGVCLCTSDIAQLSKGRNKDSSELQSLAATVLDKNYKDISPSNLSLLTYTLGSLKLSS